MQLFVFELSGQHYGLTLPSVREILRAVTMVSLPKAPEVIEGIINVRGTVVAVFDLRKRFRLPAKSLELTDRLIIAWAADRTVALRVDDVVGFFEVDAKQIDDAKPVVPGLEYVAGVAKLPDGMVLIHDLSTFLSETESAALDKAVMESDPAKS